MCIQYIATVALKKFPIQFHGKNILWYSIPGLIWTAITAKSSDFKHGLLLVPLEYKLLSVIFVPLMIFNMPFLVAFEEYIFRYGTTSWFGWNGGIVKSLAFGLVHSLFGVPIMIGLLTTITGLYLTNEYMVVSHAIGADPITLAIMDHTVYNFVIIFLMVLQSRASTKRS
ncbi:MAG: hypothetical protein WC797_04150 [Candidatus Paceibacterota bacterium]